MLNELDKRCNISDDVQKTQLKLIYSEISSMVSSVENPQSIKKL
ncbi:hypothetical protein WZ211_2066 [Enterococcus faecalis]|nr:hypothetical protein WZ211_2066 [Enterococcus faecalis]OSH44637.1 hypothetical protein YM392_2173 [Enterococcus faecalis]